MICKLESKGIAKHTRGIRINRCYWQHYVTADTDSNVRFNPNPGEIPEILLKNELQFDDERIELIGEIVLVSGFGIVSS